MGCGADRGDVHHNRLRLRRRSVAKEPTLAFAVAYAVGCIAAVVAVRQTGIFTAVIAASLILFVSVPGAYFLFTAARWTA